MVLIWEQAEGQRAGPAMQQECGRIYGHTANEKGREVAGG